MTVVMVVVVISKAGELCQTLAWSGTGRISAVFWQNVTVARTSEGMRKVVI